MRIHIFRNCCFSIISCNSFVDLQFSWLRRVDALPKHLSLVLCLCFVVLEYGSLRSLCLLTCVQYSVNSVHTEAENEHTAMFPNYITFFLPHTFEQGCACLAHIQSNYSLNCEHFMVFLIRRSRGNQPTRLVKEALVQSNAITFTDV